jgi:hypothetical protein
MSKHDTWVFLKTDSPYKDILDLFPQGIPMRDPFPLERANGAFEGEALWIIDLDRLSSGQALELTKLIAAHCKVLPIAVYEEAIAKGGFAIRAEWVERMMCGPEGMQRTRELADFLESAPQPPSAEAFMEFYEDQHRRWISGSEKPEPLPERIEDWDQQLRTPELEAALQWQRQQMN